MKKTLVALAIILVVGVAIAYAQNPGMMGGQGGWYCPSSGQWMGPGMMGPGQGQKQQQLQKPLEEKDAKAILENYIANMKNPNLKLGAIKDAGSTFEAEIVTKDGSLVDKVMVDKATGWMRSAY